MRVVRFAALALAAVFPAPFAWGQNLVFNPTFDTDVAGWSAEGTSSIVWDSLDADGNPASGSALVTNLSTTANDSTGARQCVDGLTEATFYRFAADILVPGGQSETGHAHLLAQWYGGPGCGGGQVGLVDTFGISTSTPDVWYTDSVTAEAPAGTQSARLRLSIWKNEESGTLVAHFDNVEFANQIFSDGFESGDTTAWSATVP